MSLKQLIEGRTPAEASSPAEPPVPHPEPGGGGRTPYPDYDVMAPDKWAHDWDEKTRRLVLDRIRHVPARSFFSEAEYRTLEAICHQLLPQTDRPRELRIPIVPYIDQRLAQGGGNGYRYANMPWDDEAYRLGLAGINETSSALCAGQGFADLSAVQQDAVLATIEAGAPPARPGSSSRPNASSNSSCRMRSRCTTRTRRRGTRLAFRDRPHPAVMCASPSASATRGKLKRPGPCRRTSDNGRPSSTAAQRGMAAQPISRRRGLRP